MCKERYKKEEEYYLKFKREKKSNTTAEQALYTFFVLDFDKTYDNEKGYGVTPSVYLIRERDKKSIKMAAIKAQDKFWNQYEETIGDLFEQQLERKNISFSWVGYLNLLFDQRKETYLADYIPYAIV